MRKYDLTKDQRDGLSYHYAAGIINYLRKINAINDVQHQELTGKQKERYNQKRDEYRF